MWTSIKIRTMHNICLLNLLAERFQNLCVVGDSDQSIYRWRGADITNIFPLKKIIQMPKLSCLNKTTVQLKRFLEAANGVIENNMNRKVEKAYGRKIDDGHKITYYQGND